MCCVTIAIPRFELGIIPYESIVLPTTPYSQQTDTVGLEPTTL